MTRASAAARKARFVELYFKHNENATQAAIAAGYSPHTAVQQGSRLLTDVDISAAIAKRRASLQQGAELTAEEVIASLARAVRFDPGKMYGADGKLLPVRDMPDEVRLELEGIDVDEISKLVSGGKGSKGKKKQLLSILTAKVHLPKKHAARDQAMKFFGLYAKDKPGFNPDDDSAPPAPTSITIDFKDARRRKA